MENLTVFIYRTLEEKEDAIFEDSICLSESKIEFVGTPDQGRELIVNMKKKYSANR